MSYYTDKANEVADAIAARHAGDSRAMRAALATSYPFFDLHSPRARDAWRRACDRVLARKQSDDGQSSLF